MQSWIAQRRDKRSMESEVLQVFTACFDKSNKLLNQVNYLKFSRILESIEMNEGGEKIIHCWSL